MKALLLVGLFSFLSLGVNGAVTDLHFETNLQKLIQILEPYSPALRKWVESAITDQELGRAEYLTCEICTPALALLRPYVNLVTEEQLIALIGKACEILHLAPSDDICIPTIKTYAKPVVYILKNPRTDQNLTDDDFCGIINPDCNKQVNSIYLDWTVEVDENKPPHVDVPALQDGLATATILQFTDIHLDLQYEEGMNADCVYPVCCRKEQGGETDDVTKKAGPYGHYTCALPIKALNAMFADAKARFDKPKFIFLTGDYVHSGVWQYSVEENGRHIAEVTARLAAAFPDTPVFPITGNHETDICNMYPPVKVQETPGYSLAWMYNETSYHFRETMGSEAVAQFMHTGFYTTLAEPGLRIVVLNTNICYIQNFWLPYDPIDPEGQLAWFAKVMLAAEQAGEKVYILAHIPAGSGSCWPIWSQQYDRIVTRFSHLIQAQFHGHSHREYFVVTFDAATATPITTSYVAPSAVTDSMNPGYKAYMVDGARGVDSTWEVVDHETWLLDLEASNTQNIPIWFKEFGAKDTFGLQSLRPADHYNLVLEMVGNRTLFEVFHKIHRKSSTKYEPCQDAECVSGVLCDTVVSNSADLTQCAHIQALVEASFAGEATTENAGFSLTSSCGILVLMLAFLIPRN